MSKKNLAIVPSCYIPWKDYFDLINIVDEFIFYYAVQCTKNNWRNQHPDTLDNTDDKTLRVIALCKHAKVNYYLSEPSAKHFFDENIFDQYNIHLKHINHEQYPLYSQLYGKFAHHVSILDLIFNTGSGAAKYMKSFI